MNTKSEAILQQAADICSQLPLERAMDVELWLREAAEFSQQFTPPPVEPHEVQEIRALFAREYDMERWFLWFAMSSADWEGGKAFGNVPSGYETRETWIKIDDKAIQATLNVPPIEGKIECTPQNDS